jgi:hypothetical protein
MGCQFSESHGNDLLCTDLAIHLVNIEAVSRLHIHL